MVSNGLIRQEHLLTFFCIPVPVFSRIVEAIGLVSTLEVWLFGHMSSMKATSDQTSLDSRWVYQVPLFSANSELMALLDIF